MKKWRWISIVVFLSFLLIGQAQASAPMASYISKGHTYKKSETPGFVWETRDIPGGSSIARLHSLGGSWMTENNFFDGADSSLHWSGKCCSTSAFSSVSRSGYFSKSYLEFIYPFHRFW